MPSITVANEEHWHQLRAQNIGSSEIAALFQLHPFGLTHWQLYHIKSGTLVHNVDNLSTRQGKHFEPAIAAYAQEKFDITLRKVHRYITSDDTPGLGCSVDYEEYGGGLLIPTELKFSLWGDGWDWEGDDLTEAPDAYLIQVQHQLACTGALYGQLIAFCGGDLKRMIVPRNEAVIFGIKKATRDFWADVAAKKEPPVDFLKDADAIDDMAGSRQLRSITLPPAATALCKTYRDTSTTAKILTDQAKAARAEIVKMVMDAGIGNTGKAVATCNGYVVKLTHVYDNPGKIVDDSMVGKTIGARKGFLKTTIRESKDA